MSPGSSYNAVRKWFAPYDSTIKIEGNVKMQATGGDGVTASVKIGSRTMVNTDLWSAAISGNDTTTNDTVDWDPKITILGTPSPEPDPTFPTWSASADFSSTQGENQWHYQQWDGTAYTNAGWNAAQGAWQGDQTNLWIGNNYQHPNTYDAVRKWVAPEDTVIRIRGNARMYGVGGDGVEATIKKNNQTIWGPFSISGSDTTVGISHTIQTRVRANEEIYMIVRRGGTSYFDSTLWNPAVLLQADK